MAGPWEAYATPENPPPGGPWLSYQQGSAPAFGSDEYVNALAKKHGTDPDYVRRVIHGQTSGEVLQGTPILGALRQKAEAGLAALAQPLTGAGVPGASISERYGKNLPLMQEVAADFERENPGTTMAAQLVGGGLTTGALGGTALGAKALGAVGGGLGRQMLASGASGAGIGALDAAVRGGDVGTSAEIGGAFGAAGPVAGRALGAVANRFLPSGGPSIEALKTEAGGLYDQARNMGVAIKGDAGQALGQSIRNDLFNRLGVDENLAPKTYAILGRLDRMPPGASMTVDNLQSLRRVLGSAAGSLDPTERMAASSAKGAVDHFLANVAPADIISGNPRAAAALLKEANANYAASERSASINRQLVRAQLRSSAANSGQNVANTIRQRMADVLLNPSLKRGYTPDELAQIERIVKGTVFGNITRFAGNLLGGGGGLGALASATAGGLATGGPGAVLPAVGYGLKKASEASTMGQVKALDEMLRSRAPLAATNPVLNRGAVNEKAMGVGAIASRAGAGFHPSMIGARQAPDGQHYIADPMRPGKYLRVDWEAR